MRLFWGEGRRGVARSLEEGRPKPSDEFVSKLARELDLGRRQQRSSLPRIAFAGGLTAALLVALASVGGIGYAASSASQAAKVVKRVFVPSAKDSAVTIRGLSAGGDQYRPGYGFGDKNHNHTGPPGLNKNDGVAGAFSPPAQARLAGDRHAYFVNTRINLDEQASLRISVVDRHGKALLLTQGKGARIGKGLKGKQTKTLRYTVLVPRSIPLVLRVPKNLVKPGVRYRIRVIATDPDGNRSTLYVPFSV